MTGKTAAVVGLALCGVLAAAPEATRGGDGERLLHDWPPVNSPPVLEPIGTKVVAVRSSIRFMIEATDPEDDSLTYAASGLPARATFDASRRLFAWWPSAGQRGRHRVTFSVSDGRSRASRTITIVVAGPNECEGCHGGGGRVHPGRDGVPCTDDDAPNVMTARVGTSWVSVWDGTWWDTQRGGGSATQQGGHGDADGVEFGQTDRTPTCRSCHDVSRPTGTHRDGVYNSLGSELPRGSATWLPQECLPATPRPIGNTNANTAHLLPAYFTRYPAVGFGDFRLQVAMDNYCYRECHRFNGIKDMRHEVDTSAMDANHWSVQLGTHLTADVPLLSMTDADVTTDAAGLPNHAPCVSCHNPHGSTVTDTRGPAPTGTNRMLIAKGFRSAYPFCANCHR